MRDYIRHAGARFRYDARAVPGRTEAAPPRRHLSPAAPLAGLDLVAPASPRDGAPSRALLAGDPQVVISEQVVENAMVLRNIPPEASTVLDFGAVESMLPMTLAALGRRVTVWDRRPYAFAHPLLSVVRQDFLSETPPGLGPFDIVISVPTIEHLGLDSYGDVVMDNADSRGVAVPWSLVRTGGRLIATVPVGRAVVHPGFRVCDRARLQRVFPHPGGPLLPQTRG